jgi:KaiC/GvpD/RAD55 family RecA-like ATPase
MSVNKCRGCGAEIRFITTDKARQMPVDAKRVTVVTEDGRTMTAYMPHWATCTKADDFRGGRGSAPAGGAR